MSPSPHLSRQHGPLIKIFEAMCQDVEGRSVVRRNGVVSVVTGSPIPLFNPILVENDGARPSDLSWLVRRLSDECARAAALVRSDQSRDWHQAFADIGFQTDGETTPVMALEPIPTHQPPDDLTIRTEGAGIWADHLEVVADAFGMPVALAESFMSPAMSDRTDFSFHVGYVDTEPVSTAFGFVSGESLAVFNVATRRGWQGRGFGGALTMAATAAGREAGCTVSYLQSTEAGYPVYQGLGYETVGSYEMYVSQT